MLEDAGGSEATPSILIYAEYVLGEFLFTTATCAFCLKKWWFTSSNEKSLL